MEMAEDGADIDALMEEVGEPKTVWRVEISILWMLRLMKWRVPLGVMDYGIDTDVTALSGWTKNQGTLG